VGVGDKHTSGYDMILNTVAHLQNTQARGDAITAADTLGGAQPT
jgi:hypothetical protein